MWLLSKALSMLRAEAGANLGLVVVADGIEQEVLEALFLEHLAENVEYASFEASR